MTRSRFREVVLQGPDGWTQGFLDGYLRALGRSEDVLDAEREGFDCAPLRERVRDLLAPSATTFHLLVPEEVEPALEAAVRTARAEGHPLEIRGSRPLRGARFGFGFRIHSPEHAERIRRDFESPPVGAQLLPGARFEETLHPDAEGAEMFAPDPAYTLEAAGTIEGDIPAVLDLYRRYREEELVRLEPLHLLDAPG